MLELQVYLEHCFEPQKSSFSFLRSVLHNSKDNLMSAVAQNDALPAVEVPSQDAGTSMIQQVINTGRTLTEVRAEYRTNTLGKSRKHKT